jgi:hypothetical protein
MEVVDIGTFDSHWRTDCSSVTDLDGSDRDRDHDHHHCCSWFNDHDPGYLDHHNDFERCDHHHD